MEFRQTYLIFFILFVSFFSVPFLSRAAIAEYPERFLSFVFINKETIKKGYTLQSTDGNFFLGLTPGVLHDEASVTLKNFWTADRIASTEFGSLRVSDNRYLPQLFGGQIPMSQEILGDIYEFDIANSAELYNSERPLWIKIKNPASSVDDRWKGIFYFDKGKQQWVEIPSSYDADNRVFKAAIHLPYAMIGVLTMSKQIGLASWYKYKDCDCTAAIDYPKGALLRVTNLDNGKSIDVTVNDYGPERWTKRLVDLDKTAFAKIGSPRIGLLNVFVELLAMPQIERK